MRKILFISLFLLFLNYIGINSYFITYMFLLFISLKIYSHYKKIGNESTIDQVKHLVNETFDSNQQDLAVNYYNQEISNPYEKALEKQRLNKKALNRRSKFYIIDGGKK